MFRAFVQLDHRKSQFVFILRLVTVLLIELNEIVSQYSQLIRP